jgi:hypothetical protein
MCFVKFLNYYFLPKEKKMKSKIRSMRFTIHCHGNVDKGERWIRDGHSQIAAAVKS